MGFEQDQAWDRERAVKMGMVLGAWGSGAFSPCAACKADGGPEPQAGRAGCSGGGESA